MADYYVSTSGDDTTGDGSTGNAWRTISHAISECSSALAVDNTILLKGAVGGPLTWDTEPNNEIDLEDFVCTGTGALTIAPECWNEDNYLGGYDPFDATAGAGTLDPTAARPCKVKARIKGSRAMGVTIKGLELVSTADYETGIDVEGSSQISIKYCSLSGFMQGMDFTNTSKDTVFIENCYIHDCTLGITAALAQISMVGENVIKDQSQVGIFLNDGAKLKVTPFDKPGFSTMKIITTQPRKEYVALKAMLGSRVMLHDYDYGISEMGMAVNRCYLQILNENSFRSTDYFGVVLESQSILLGADQIFFNDPDVSEGKDTVPEGQKVVTSSSGGTVVAQ